MYSTHTSLPGVSSLRVCGLQDPGSEGDADQTHVGLFEGQQGGVQPCRESDRVSWAAPSVITVPPPTLVQQEVKALVSGINTPTAENKLLVICCNMLELLVLSLCDP